jgi:hypothetical protein
MIRRNSESEVSYSLSEREKNKESEIREMAAPTKKQVFLFCSFGTLLGEKFIFEFKQFFKWDVSLISNFA